MKKKKNQYSKHWISGNEGHGKVKVQVSPLITSLLPEEHFWYIAQEGNVRWSQVSPSVMRQS